MANVSNLKVGSTTYYITDTTSGYVTAAHTHDYSKVSFTQTNTTGDEIGKITIDGVTTTLYADADTDTKVSQVLTSTDANYPIIFAYDTSTTTTATRTNTVRRDNDFYYNPSSNKVTVANVAATAATITTLTANGVLVGKSGAVSAGNYTTAVPTAAGTTGQIMFVLMS